MHYTIYVISSKIPAINVHRLKIAIGAPPFSPHTLRKLGKKKMVKKKNLVRFFFFFLLTQFKVIFWILIFLYGLVEKPTLVMQILCYVVEVYCRRPTLFFNMSPPPTRVSVYVRPYSGMKLPIIWHKIKYIHRERPRKHIVNRGLSSYAFAWCGV